MDFSEALFILKSGGSVRRASWVPQYKAVSIETDKGKSRFVMTFDTGENVDFTFAGNMILACDWSEVKP